MNYLCVLRAKQDSTIPTCFCFNAALHVSRNFIQIKIKSYYNSKSGSTIQLFNLIKASHGFPIMRMHGILSGRFMRVCRAGLIHVRQTIEQHNSLEDFLDKELFAGVTVQEYRWAGRVQASRVMCTQGAQALKSHYNIFVICIICRFQRFSPILAVSLPIDFSVVLCRLMCNQ